MRVNLQMMLLSKKTRKVYALETLYFVRYLLDLIWRITRVSSIGHFNLIDKCMERCLDAESRSSDFLPQVFKI